VVKPASKKPIVARLVEYFHLSERAACNLVGLSRTAYRYKSKLKGDQALRERLKTLAVQHSRYGYLLLHGLLKAEGLVVNKKRTYRIYTEEGLQVRTKKRKKLQRPRLPMEVPTAPNQRWSMDFVSDQLSDGRRFRVLNVVDDYSREMVGQLVSVSISGRRVARFLNELAGHRSLPPLITCDNGPEFTSKAMFFWAKERNSKLGFIQPGKPTQNAFVESLNGKFRNECLNQHWFRSMDEAREEIDKWRDHYNTVRPHSSLGYLPPVEFSKQAA
jgi:Transposase and inactivated derivatives